MTALATQTAAVRPKSATRIVALNGTRDPLYRRLISLLEPYHGLRYAQFVDHFYAGNQWCRLNVLANDADDILGVLVHEIVPFSVPGGRTIKLGFGSNFRAFQPGAGGVLFLNWLKQCNYGLVFGGSPDTHQLLSPQRWTTYPGVSQFELNAAFAEVPGETFWRSAAKSLLRSSPFRRSVDSLADVLPQVGNVHVEEQAVFTPDLFPGTSPFDFRMQPNRDYLNWRYQTGLDFVCYRIFRIVRGSKTAGFVVLNEQQHRVLVAHADADDSLTLARGIIAALAVSSSGARRKQGVVLTAADDTLRETFRQLGFRERMNARPFVIGSLIRKPDWSEDTSRWLVNFDWCDNGVRPPFLGQQPVR